ncbi:hypothetical protein DFJ73DRAFT_172410 [Zopfochytrium polystomum]|nr:hypothetical protein DFJ73DRAFT_172410 [Zopfochytrium polystomum]
MNLGLLLYSLFLCTIGLAPYTIHLCCLKKFVIVWQFARAFFLAHSRSVPSHPFFLFLQLSHALFVAGGSFSPN